jgi:DNA adenine methylase
MILHWVGGKRKIMSQLLKLFPKEYNDYYEPFLGGGSVFFSFFPKGKAFLSDINAELINTFVQCKHNPVELVKTLERIWQLDCKAFFLKIGNKRFKTPIMRAARFVYLNKRCFNGMMKHNKAGRWIGTYNGNYKENKKTKKIYSMKDIYEANLLFLDAEITNQSYHQIKPKKGDFVYLDPPYYNTLDCYTATGFSKQDQIDLRDFCIRLNESGVKFALSNSHNDFILDLYKDFQIHLIDITYTINFLNINATKEVLIRNYTE